MEKNVQCAVVRVLNAACFVPTVRVCVGSREIAEKLCFGEVSERCRINAGFRRVSVMHAHTGEVLWSETLPFSAGEKKTLVICNTMHSVSLIVTEENGSLAGRGKSCIRLGNFSFDEGPFRLCTKEGSTIFSAVAPREISSLCPARCGSYELVVQREEAYEAREGNDSLSLKIELQNATCYTICILGADNEELPLRLVLLEF